MSSRRWLAAAAVLSVVASACGGVAPTTSPSAAATVGAPSPGNAPSNAAPACAPPATSPPEGDWWRDRVFYEVFVRSFADSDRDGIGDLRGLTQRLDYLNDGDPGTTDDLGVTALWLMPVAESPSYHGYDVVDYRTIEADYGTNADFVDLVGAARERGIEIIVDLVMNHSSVEHPWFVDARERGSTHEDWYVWADERPEVSGPAGRPVWHQAGDRWYYGYFWEGMPDLNVAAPAVADELDEIARFWLEDMGVAGFRLDAARHLIEDGDVLENAPANLAWLAAFRDRVHATHRDALVLGEVWDATSNAARYVRDGALDLTFDFGLAGQMLSAVRFGDAESLRIIQAEVSAAYPAGGYAAFLTNHDQDRVMDTVGRDPVTARQAATLLLTNPGVPFVYYGEEVGLRGRKPDERIRTPMPWTDEAPGFGFSAVEPWQPMAEDTAASNVSAQDADPDSLLSHYRSLIALRAAHPALGPMGALVPVDASVAGVYAVLRHEPASGESVLIVSNLTKEPVTGVVLSLAEGPLCGSPTAAVLLGADTGIAPPIIGRSGGLEPWAIGDLGAHEDRIVVLAP